MPRPTQFHEGGFDPPPGGGLLAVVVFFECLGLVRGFGDRLGALRFVELAGVTLNLGCVHKTLHWLFLRDGFWLSLWGNARRPRRVPRGKEVGRKGIARKCWG